LKIFTVYNKCVSILFLTICLLNAEPFKCSAFISVCCQLYCTVLLLSVLPSFRLSKIFFVAFFSVTVDGRNLIFDHGLMISFITLTCTDGQQLNKQYNHNDFQVDVPDSIGVSKIYLSMYV
jgi:hypothetical protein